MSLSLADMKALYVGLSATVDSPLVPNNFTGVVLNVRLDTDNTILIVVEDGDGDVFDIPIEDVELDI